ncbi:cytidine deaminase [Spiroplasma endosymbiont of Labia minor]|uniref:cytidine deaminase n=1 Tax=Spiroplasma endosymbiont of Labia minor TaxID=3066305 RepID=UPI0030D5D356
MKEYFVKLNKLKDNAYCPYSKFNVSCIVVLQDGQEISGVNVENAAFPSGMCAERTAVSQVITKGYNPDKIKEIHLYTISENIGAPCGQCRQFLVEFLNPNIPIYIYNKYDFKIKTNISELLPLSFTNLN